MIKSWMTTYYGIALLVAACTGCGGSGGVERMTIRGSVTYSGQPVPAGKVRFEPDTRRGGSGPVGFARIVDGEFSTRGNGKGAVQGPMKVRIEGYVSAEPMAPPLFQPYIAEIEITKESREFDFEVPQREAKQSKRRPPR